MSATGAGNREEIVILGALPQALTAELQQRYVVHPVYEASDPLAKLAAVGANCRAAVGHGMAGLTAAHLERLPKLEICALHGVGLETSDLPAIRARGVKLTTTPVLFDDVADLAIALALACCREIPRADRYVRSGAWSRARLSPGRKLSGMRAGIMGLGRIGGEIARRLEGFNCKIGYADPVREEPRYRRFDDAVDLARNCDVFFLAAAGGPKGSPPLVDAQVLGALGPRGIFINISRGWLVDEPSLISALVDKRLGAAGLDVLLDEPEVPEPLLALDNVVLTPHIASSTEETLALMRQCVLDNLESWFSGGGALTSVT
jgi:lactate dehydrogenase-like 2-hydroxyacid dehydrogenase